MAYSSIPPVMTATATASLDTNGGWVDDAQNVDELNITLNNGSKWVGSANMSAEVIAPADMYGRCAEQPDPWCHHRS